MTTDELVVASWNVKDNGRGTSTGARKASSILADFKPHIVLRQELTDAARNGGRALYAEAEEIGGLSAFMAETKKDRSSHPPGIMFDPHLFTTVARADQDMPWKPICGVQVRLKGCPKPITLASAHLTHYSHPLRDLEAARLTVFAERDRAVLIGLDANSYPHRATDETTDPIDWDDGVEDATHIQHRTVEIDGRRVPHTTPSRILTGGTKPVFTDLGHHAATRLGQPGALAFTASLTRKDQGPPQRIDWILGTHDWADALLGVEVVNTGLEALSDHGLVIARFDLKAVQKMLTPTG
ncbi:endonuclease/exonuclease/phosphatase family protein [Streptomyces sp. NPDC056716]|uniref:endonuclease/exonuclease/phosphatase family protein n=1 Tax=unclassified Streptomyces TaxID=2593676 RepID=UPI0036BF0B15